MKYKVLQRFLTESALYMPGGIYEIPTSGKFTKRLLEYGFIERISNKEQFLQWEKGGIVSKLANVIIAPEDYTEDSKEHFTWDEAMAIEEKLKNGWRLPTRHEWVLIAEEFGRDTEKDEFGGKLLKEALSLNMNGYKDCDGRIWSQGSIAYYWSRTANSSTNAYYLYLNSSGNLYPAYINNRYYGYSVRCVKEI